MPLLVLLQVTLMYYASRGPSCDLVVANQGQTGPDGFGPGILVYGLQKNSPLTEPFDNELLNVRMSFHLVLTNCWRPRPTPDCSF